MLSGGNKYRGPTTVAAGVLKLGKAQNLPKSALVINTPVAGIVGAAFDLGGFSATFGSLASDTHTTGGFVTNTGAAATLTVGADNSSTFFGGSLTNGTNALNFTKTGTGTLTLTGTNSATGNTTLTSGGSLTLDYTNQNTSKLGTGSLTLAGGTLTLTGNASAPTIQSVGSTFIAGGRTS